MALMSIRFYAKSLGQCTDITVLMPQNLAEGEKIPVLYLLHGYSDDCTIWERRTALERYVGDRKLCVVMPSGHASWYTDNPLGAYFNYIAVDLPEQIHSFFPQVSTRREDTYIAGLSMGGYGAMKCALTYPEKYSFVGALSAAFDIGLRLCRGGMYTALFGTKEQYEGSINDIYATAKRLAGSGADIPRMYIACGGEDECCLDDNITFPKHLKELGYEFEYVFDHGHHSWEYWDRHIQEVLKRI